MTNTQARTLARAFVAAFVSTGRQWSTADLEGYLPASMQFRPGVDYAGPATIEDLAAFIQAEARPYGEPDYIARNEATWR